LTKSGASTVALNSANTYGGKTTITAVNCRYRSIRLGTLPASYTADAITLNGGGIRLQVTAADYRGQRGITLGAGAGVIDVPSGVSPSINSIISGAGALTKIVSGNLNL